MTELLTTCCVNGELPLAEVDYLDDIPSQDAHFVTAQGLPHDIVYADTYIPAAFELSPITTDELTRSFIDSHYRPSTTKGITLGKVTQSIKPHAKLFEPATTSSAVGQKPKCDALWQVIVVETLNAWLSATNRWLEYAPPPLGVFKMSQCQYLFTIPSFTKDGEEEEEGEIQLSNSSFVKCCMFVYKQIREDDIPDEWITAITFNIKATLHSMGFKEIPLPLDNDSVTITRCNVPGSSNCIYINRGGDTTVWTHLLVQPGRSILESEDKAQILAHAGMVLSRKNLELLRTHNKTKETSPSKNKRKREEKVSAEEKNMNELKKVFASYNEVVHPSRLRYSCYISGGVVCGHPRKEYWDPEYSPLGVNALLWDWIKQRQQDTPYVNQQTRKLQSGPRLCMDAPKGVCTTLVNSQGQSKWYVDTVVTKRGLLAEPFIRPLIEHDEHKVCPDRFHCIQSCVEAFGLLCTTYTEVWATLMALFPTLTLEELYLSYTTVKQQRLGHLLGSAWLNNPDGWKVLIDCARHLLEKDHTPLMVHAKSARDRLCNNLGYGQKHRSDVAAGRMISSSIEIRDLDANELISFESMHEYLYYCEYIINSKLIWPIVRCWNYIHPKSIGTDSLQVEKSAVLSRIHASILKEVMGLQFQGFLNRQNATVGINGIFNKEMFTIALLALRHSTHHEIAEPIITKIETLFAVSSIAHEHDTRSFLDACERRIRSMLQFRRVVDTKVLLDIADKFAIMVPSVSDPFVTIAKLLLGIAQEVPHERFKALYEFKTNRDNTSTPRDYLLDRIASHIHLPTTTVVQ